MFDALVEKGFQVEFHSRSRAIIAGDFPDAAGELGSVLLAATIPIEEIVASGGGEAKGTQRLRRGLTDKGWTKQTFTVRRTINGREKKEAITHEIDHVKTWRSTDGLDSTIALEIEWNNKDPFYDRDLENFKRLHADGAISIGIIVTRGRSLHDSMRSMAGRFAEERQVRSFDDLERWGYTPTRRRKAAIEAQVSRSKPPPLTFQEAFACTFVADKFGEATTHWRKLEDRVRRGVGNPCPLVLIGLTRALVSFGEDPALVSALVEEAALIDDA